MHIQCDSAAGMQGGGASDPGGRSWRPIPAALHGKHTAGAKLAATTAVRVWQGEGA